MIRNRIARRQLRITAQSPPAFLERALNFHVLCGYDRPGIAAALVLGDQLLEYSES
ncbi:MAG: hypothetical protein O6650_03970 [Actinobacteria bacterium]|nr:hypothetical protein [Actinomycetota bacterium]MCZ6856929.1 hypothetical protein [Gemmatimonadota bacterium]